MSRLLSLALALTVAHSTACATARSSKIALGVGAAATVASIPVGAFASSERDGLSGQGRLAAGLAVTGVVLLIVGGVGLWRAADDPLAPQ